jgi:hypothetical protein
MRRSSARIGVAITALLFALTGVARSDEAPSRESSASRSIYRVKVTVIDAAADLSLLAGYDVAGRDLKEGWVEVITDRDGLLRLVELQLPFEIVEERPSDAAGRAPPGGGLADTAYTDLSELEAFLTQVAADHPTIARLEVIGTSVQGRPIRAMMISDNAAQDEDELTVLFNGGHHPREVMTHEAVMDIIGFLTDNYGNDPQVTALVDAYQIWCVPLVNPDGLELVFTEDIYWRKNARDNDENGRITWKDGVDVNRNYEWGWGNQCLGSSGTRSEATYRGPAEATEPEARAMIDLGRRIRPVFYVEYHSYGEDVFYAMGCDPVVFSPRLSTVPGPDSNIARVIAEDYASRIVQADGQPGFIAAPFGNRVDGIGRDHHAHENGSVAFVTELNTSAEGGFQPDFATWRDATVIGQRPGWLWLIERSGGPAIGGHVRDAQTGEPLAADIALDELTLPDGRRLASRGDTGRFHLIVVPGNYTLRVSAPGYAEATIQVDVVESWQPLEVALTPSGAARVVFDDFEDALTVADWTAGSIDDTATAGIWEWGEPESTHSGDVPSGTLRICTPALDRTPGEGRHAFVTGNPPGAEIEQGDVDGGVTQLISPSFDLDGRYAVELSWQQWLCKDPSDPLDGLALDVSTDDGQSWIAVGEWTASSSTGTADQSWIPIRLRLDDFARPGPLTRLRFRVSDDGPDNAVEAAVDDLEIRGFSLESQGLVGGLRFTDPAATTLEWQGVPGADDVVYEIVRGDLANLTPVAGAVDVGPLTCLAADESGTVSTAPAIAEDPPPGVGWFYLARFRLGYSEGLWGSGSNGEPREGSAGCAVGE